MRGGLLAGLAVIAALVVLGSATASWATSTTPGQVVEGVRLPPETVGLTGAGEAPASVSAAAAAFLTVLPLALVSTADRIGRTTGRRGPGTAARAAASLLGATTVLLAAVAVVGQFAAPHAAGGVVEVSVTPAVGLFGLAAVLVLALGVLSWRVPRTAAAAEPSRYTVEAVRGEVPSAPEEDDEWDRVEADASAADRTTARSAPPDTETRP